MMKADFSYHTGTSILNLEVPLPNSTREYTIDSFRKKFNPYKKLKTCSSCQFLKLQPSLSGYSSPKCTYNDNKHLAISDDFKLDSGSYCESKGLARCYIPHSYFSLKHFIEENAELNSNIESDYYEVYEHFTGKTVKVNDGWFKTKEIRHSFFYILKNGTGFYCEEWFRGALSYGFVPLELFPDEEFSIPLLKRFHTAEDAIRMCDTLNSWSNKKGNLIYSTQDSLETRFRDLERNKKSS